MGSQTKKAKLKARLSLKGSEMGYRNWKKTRIEIAKNSLKAILSLKGSLTGYQSLKEKEMEIQKGFDC